MKRLSLADISGITFDIVVVGGGITGASIARDAAMRGLTVALLEKDDFASGTSSRSTKLLHGGLRYLEQYEFKLVREACRERELFLRLAPHLAEIRPFIYLLYRGYPESPLLLNLGLTIYDIFSGNPIQRHHHMLNAKRTLELEPDLNPDQLIGGGWYYDVLTNDARLTVETTKSAGEAGASIGNYLEVVGLVQESGKVHGVEVTDRLTGAQAVIRAKCVINASGVWVDRVRALENGISDLRLRPTKGVHIVVRKSDFPLQHAVFLRSPKDRRVVWPIPALDGDLVYIGTTDTFYEGKPEEVTATQQDIDYLLEVANHTIPDAKLSYGHIVGTWAGLRPLFGAKPGVAASSVSREHEIFVSPGGLVNIAGGKLTTARVMAFQTVDAALRLYGDTFANRHPKPCTTDQKPLCGGDAEGISAAKQTLQSRHIPSAIAQRWLSHYGSNALRLAETVSADPGALQEMGSAAITPAEVRFAVENEMARTVSDFFIRRATVFFWHHDGGLQSADGVAAEMAKLLGWSSAECTRQVQNYRQEVEHNRFTPVSATTIPVAK
jgi:glycerol-3-phosphate dehydrogenase